MLCGFEVQSNSYLAIRGCDQLASAARIGCALLLGSVPLVCLIGFGRCICRREVASFARSRGQELAADSWRGGGDRDKPRRAKGAS